MSLSGISINVLADWMVRRNSIPKSMISSRIVMTWSRLALSRWIPSLSYSFCNKMAIRRCSSVNDCINAALAVTWASRLYKETFVLSSWMKVDRLVTHWLEALRKSLSDATNQLSRKLAIQAYSWGWTFRQSSAASITQQIVLEMSSKCTIDAATTARIVKESVVTRQMWTIRV